MTKKGLTLNIFLFLIANIFLETAAQMCFKKTAVSQEGFNIIHHHDIFVFLGHMLSSPFLWLGWLAVLLIFTNWSTILSKIDLSIATPIASLSYVLVTLACLIFLHEHVSLLRWSGIIFILGGVSLVSTSKGDS